MQLVDDATTVYLTKRGVTQLEAMTPETVLESTGVTTEQIVDWKALMGDTSDNIPGVAGIGPKTASKLLRQFPTLDEIFARLDEVSGKKLVERLTENKDIAYISRELATIKTDVEISTDLSEMEPQGRVDEARTLFERLGFRSMLEKMQAAHIITLLLAGGIRRGSAPHPSRRRSADYYRPRQIAVPGGGHFYFGRRII